ncbi:MAG: hypothetical protein J1D85_03555 [Bacteroidales bacterium]|nr:hypothetical protein [Bacteroidales bacterium]
MNDFVVSIMLLGALSSGGSLPFWAVSNQGGLMPESSGAAGIIRAAKPFAESGDFRWKAGASLAFAAPYSVGDYGIVPDELYAGMRWKSIGADLGMVRREAEYMGSDPSLGSLSVTEGHIVESNNARAMPGYRLLLDRWAIPFTGGRLQLSGSWGDYKTLDERYMNGALVHRLSGYLRYDGGKHFYAQLGIDHYAQWGGTGIDGVSMDVNWGNYFRVATGRPASEGGTLSDRMNVIGCHGGAEQLRMGWRESAFAVHFQYEKPYADKSGMRFNNIPDGVYTLDFSLADKDSWVSDALVEFHYTMWQSGTIHDKETDEDGNQLSWFEDHTLNVFGGDDYFNNSRYKSGWTHFGRSICAPLFFAAPYGEYPGIVSNRYKALHFGLSGKLFRKAPYRLMLTASENYGTYRRPFISPSTWDTGWNWWEPNTIDKGLKQFSAALNGYVPFRFGKRVSLDLLYGLYADAGRLLEDNFGLTAGVRINIE